MIRVPRSRGFSFLEVLCVLLILTLGMLSAVALLRYGLRLSQAAQSASLAYPTARSLLHDAKPLGVAAADWSSPSASTWQGYVNGMWVKRTVADQTVVGDLIFASVTVEVFWSDSSSRSLTLSERISFHVP